jgi:hypothetical protein
MASHALGQEMEAGELKGHEGGKQDRTGYIEPGDEDPSVLLGGTESEETGPAGQA